MEKIKRYENERQLYKDYQWVWDLTSDPDDYKDLADYVIDKILKNQIVDTKTVLHLGCGSGCMDYHLKKHFELTGVDLSEDMIKSAQVKNPECSYFMGDMRDFKLDKKYDAIIIPDSIDYMLSAQEIEKVYKNAKRLLNANGLFLVIVGYEPEKFPQNRTTVDEAANGDRVVTSIENNYVSDYSTNSFEATFVFLIREKGKLETIIDVQKLGLFKREIWFNELINVGFSVEIIDDPYLVEIEQEGTYLLIGRLSKK